MNSTKVANTEKLLFLISKHLSSRSRLRHEEYFCCISTNMISFYPKEDVFPDKFHKKLGDKISLLYHILIDHFDLHIQELSSIRHAYCINILDNKFVPGVYKYSLSINKKTRRWVRLN